MSTPDLPLAAKVYVVPARVDLLATLEEKGDEYKGESQVKLCEYPIYLKSNWQLVYKTLNRPATGASLATLTLYGIDELGELEEVQEYDNLRREIQTSRDFNMRARNQLYKMIGTSRRPGLVLPLTVPSGDTEPWYFKCSSKAQGLIYGRASELGMSVSNFGIIILGKGLATQPGVDPELIATVDNDFKRLGEAIGERIPELRELFAFYKTPGNEGRR